MAVKAFSGGEKLKAHLAELAKKAAQGGTLNVGFLAGATYPDGTPVPLVAATNEFGVPSHGQPPRSYFRRMIKKESPHWGADLAALLKANNYDAVKSLHLMGENIKGELQQSIIDLVSPPLRPSTIARKGFEKPLIDTSHMLNSADFEVKP